MNKVYASAAVLLLASQLTSPLRADSEPSTTSNQQMRGNREEKMLEMLTKKLNLSADQQKSVKAVLDSQSEKMKALGSGSMDQRKAIHENTDAEIEKLLTDDQKKQYEQWKTERKQQFQHRQQNRQ